MRAPPRRASTATFEHALAAQRAKRYYILRLYVAGATARSARTIFTLKTLCEKYLRDRYELHIIDIYQQPHLARQEQIVAVPLLVKHAPTPVRRFVGDLRDGKRLLAGLEIPIGEAA